MPYVFVQVISAVAYSPSPVTYSAPNLADLSSISVIEVDLCINVDYGMAK